MKLKKKIIIFLLIIIFLHNINFFKNIFDLSFRPYYHRLVRELGQCEKSGYGFVWQVNQMNIGENIRTLNFANYPSVDSLFFKNNKSISEKYFILINFDEKNKEHIKKLQDFSYNIGIKVHINENFKIIKKNLSCYLISTTL